MALVDEGEGPGWPSTLLYFLVKLKPARLENIFEAWAPLFSYGLDKWDPLLLEDLNLSLIGKGSTVLVIWPEF